jgi:inner membrane protein
MASAVTHFIVAAALALPAAESNSLRGVLPRWGIPISCGLLAVAPDSDTFAMRAFDIPYGSFFGHRGFFHSPFFLILFSALLAAIVARRRARSTWLRLALIWAGAAITHPLLDMLTDGGAGVMLLYPFSEARFFFPWRPIHVSPLDISSFFSRAGYILLSELPFCAAAVAIGLAGYAIAARSFSFRKRL